MLAKQSKQVENQERLKNILNYLEEEKQIILSNLEAPYFSYQIFNPFNSINLRQFIDLINTDQSYKQQDYICYFINYIINLMNKEHQQLNQKQLQHNQISLENILIFQSDSPSFLNMTLGQIQLKFFNFQDSFSKNSNDKSQINQISLKLMELNDKIKTQFQNKQFGNQKGLLEDILEQINKKPSSKKIKLSYLINPFKVEYYNQVTQLFKQKLKEINQSSFIEVLLWQQYYYHSLLQKSQEQLQYSIFNCMDMTIQIYRETQSRLQNKLIQETNLFNQFYQSQFRQRPEYNLEIEELYLESQKNLNIYLENEFVILIKNKFPDLAKRDLKLDADEIYQKLWMQTQIKLQEQYIKQALDSILKSIKRFDNI